jgi:hypothetical protein
MDLMAGLRGDLGDARSHRADADDRYGDGGRRGVNAHETHACRRMAGA